MTAPQEGNLRPGFEMRPETRWAYIAPALGGFLFIGHALEDAGPFAAMPYAMVFLLSLVSLLRPTIGAWVVLCVAYGAYLALTVTAFVRIEFSDWQVFFLIGLVPAVALWFARPRRKGNKG